MSNPQKARAAVVEEDFDDLDDVLEQFNTVPAKSKTAAPVSTSSSPAPPPPPPQPSTSTSSDAAKPPPPKPFGPAIDDLNLTDDFARELAEGMASLMREIAAESGVEAPAAATGEGTAQDREREMAFRKAWEEMLVEGMEGAMNVDGLRAGATPPKQSAAKENDATASASGASKATSAGAGAGDLKDDAFQASIRRAMDKLKESDSSFQAESASGATDPLEALLSQLQDSPGGGEDELQGILETMMSQLMTKEILYEPLKELRDKFPGYLKDNASSIKPEDKTRYEAQQVVVGKIVETFEGPSYSDDDPQLKVKIAELMNEMQSHGSPPGEIMGPLPPGLDAGADGMPQLPDGCTIA